MSKEERTNVYESSECGGAYIICAQGHDPFAGGDCIDCCAIEAIEWFDREQDEIAADEYFNRCDPVVWHDDTDDSDSDDDMPPLVPCTPQDTDDETGFPFNAEQPNRFHRYNWYEDDDTSDSEDMIQEVQERMAHYLANRIDGPTFCRFDFPATDADGDAIMESEDCDDW